MAINNFTTEKKVVPIDDVIPNPYNPNYMDKAMFEKARKSLEELGMLGSIIVRNYAGHFQIMDGEHRWKVAKELGWTEIPVEVIVGEVSDDQAKLLTVLINNLRGRDDIFNRAEIFNALDEGQLQLLPFTAEEIENEKKFVKFDFSTLDPAKEPTERKFGMLVVLQLTSEEGAVWNAAKEKLVERGKIDKDDSKKRQNVQMAMYLVENMLNIFEGGSPDEHIKKIEI